jgi:hypothetical protein
VITFGSDAIRIVPSDRPQSGVKTPEEIARMSPADRLDYTRSRSQQTKMPDWRDPRAVGQK